MLTSLLCLVQFQKRLWTARCPCGHPGGCVGVPAASWEPRTGLATSACSRPTTGCPALSSRRRRSVSLTAVSEPSPPGLSGCWGQGHSQAGIASPACARPRTGPGRRAGGQDTWEAPAVRTFLPDTCLECAPLTQLRGLCCHALAGHCHAGGCLPCRGPVPSAPRTLQNHTPRHRIPHPTWL